MATIATLSVLVEAKGQRKFLGDFAKVTAAIAAATVAAGKFAERGGKILTVQSAFNRLTGRQTDAIDRLRLSTQGLISDYDLMEQANLSLALGSSRSIEEFSTLAATAQQLGRALGLDTAFALNSLNIGIARQSRLVLDNIGLIVDAEEANRRYADAIGVSVSALTDAQRSEAFRQEALRQAIAKTEELGEVTLNAGDAFRQFVVEIKNTTDALSTTAASSGIVGAAYLTLAEIMRGLRGEYRDTGELAREFEESLNRQAEALARNEGRGTFTAEVEAARAAMVAQLDAARAFGETTFQARLFGEEMQRLQERLRPLPEIVINPLTGRLSELSVEMIKASNPARFFGEIVMPEFDHSMQLASVSADALRLRLAALKKQNDDLAASFSKVSGILGSFGQIASAFGLSIPGLSPALSFLGGSGSLFGLFGGGKGKAKGKAMGGPVSGGTPYVVGERGPEMFVPNQSGTIIPNGGITVNVGPARDPISFSRDQDWLRAIAETNRNLMDGGFAFS